VLRVAVVVALLAALAAGATGHAQPLRTACGGGSVQARLSWGVKCLHAGEFCKVSRDVEYHRYGFHCHTGARLSRTATRGNSVGGGCQPGYSPCLPRVPDLNCADIPASKRPVRVTGSDPYRLDGNGDGIACA
jgi:hypothetical protein